jgi:hypothetical protein
MTAADDETMLRVPRELLGVYDADRPSSSADGLRIEPPRGCRRRRRKRREESED